MFKDVYSRLLYTRTFSNYWPKLRTPPPPPTLSLFIQIKGMRRKGMQLNCADGRNGWPSV